MNTLRENQSRLIWKGRKKNLYVRPAMSVNGIRLLKINHSWQTNVRHILSSYKVLKFLSTYYPTEKNWDISKKKLLFPRQIICDPFTFLMFFSSIKSPVQINLCALQNLHITYHSISHIIQYPHIKKRAW